MKPLFILNKSTNPCPEYKTFGASGLDLRASHGGVIKPMTQVIFGTGLHMQIPVGFEGQVRCRSGFSTDNLAILTNGVGTIDSDYRGEVKVALFNLSAEDVVVCEGDRIAQLIIAPYERVEIIPVSELEKTERGEKGFGSTGIK